MEFLHYVNMSSVAEVSEVKLLPSSSSKWVGWMTDDEHIGFISTDSRGEEWVMMPDPS
jgi:hypothetical protein